MATSIHSKESETWKTAIKAKAIKAKAKAKFKARINRIKAPKRINKTAKASAEAFFCYLKGVGKFRLLFLARTVAFFVEI